MGLNIQLTSGLVKVKILKERRCRFEKKYICFDFKFSRSFNFFRMQLQQRFDLSFRKRQQSFFEFGY